ncbi:hypothetical protein [Fundidesulfovibrio putealis]|uniref:hypothetical protein n=1 Tax=Fundidesulfovibrio putealis TaxID=270496 RepID=UPI0005BA5718|nr:hypothetical protein [Fundidesulfovibrio putealis]
MNSSRAWVFGLLGVAALAVLLYFVGGSRQGLRVEELLATQVRKGQVVAQMRIDLLTAVEAEKNVLLAGTVQAAGDFADKARKASDAVEKGRVELEAISRRDDIAPQTELLAQFSKAWTEFRTIDAVLLELAVQKTNDQAARLSATRGLDLLLSFQKSLESAMFRGPQGATGSQFLPVQCFKAYAGAATVLGLQAPHIAESVDANMDALEARIAAAAAQTRAALDAAQSAAPGSAKADLAEARAVFGEFMAVNAKIIALSRINSDVKSLALSMERKRMVAASCLDTLGELQDSINERLSKARR